MAFQGLRVWKMGSFGCCKKKKLFHVPSPLQWYKKFRTHNNGSLQKVWASSVRKSTADELKKEKWRFKVLGFERGGVLAAEKKKLFHVPSPLQWYKTFRTHNNGSLQQVRASSIGKSTVDELKKEKWRFKVLGFEKGGVLAAEKKETFSCLKSTAVVQKVPHSQ